MIKRKFFGRNIEPSCEYCKYGKISEFDGNLLCEKNGILSEFISCRKFVYDPLKRKPKTQRNLPKFDKEDFTL